MLDLLPQVGGLARDTLRVECARNAPTIRKGVNAETTDELEGGMVTISLTTPAFCLVRLEQSNDWVGIRYTRHWSQLMEPPQFLRLLQFRYSRFYLSIFLRLHQSSFK